MHFKYYFKQEIQCFFHFSDFLYKLFSIILQIEKLGTTTRFALQSFNPFYEYIKYLAEVKNLKEEQAEEEQSHVDENAV